jgi:5-methylcytosine-specific restriction endonuclease McrA
MVADKRREKCDACRQVDRALRRRADKRRRRALKLGVATERYSLAEIAVRDKFTCGICRGRVDMDAKAPHPKSPSIDHVWPLARGGDDTRANVQLSHWLCNVAKSDQGGGEQLALVG